MDKLMIVSLILVSFTSANAWDWQSIKENMSYEDLVKAIGVPNDVDNFKESSYGIETVEAVYSNLSSYRLLSNYNLYKRCTKP